MGNSGMSDRKRQVLRSYAFQPDGEIQGKLAKQPLSVRLPEEIDDWYRRKGVAFIRQVLVEKFEVESEEQR